eukprot:247742-Pelagomonas_calceolata.AAC.1
MSTTFMMQRRQEGQNATFSANVRTSQDRMEHKCARARGIHGPQGSKIHMALPRVWAEVDIHTEVVIPTNAQGQADLARRLVWNKHDGSYALVSNRSVSNN